MMVCVARSMAIMGADVTGSVKLLLSGPRCSERCRVRGDADLLFRKSLAVPAWKSGSSQCRRSVRDVVHGENAVGSLATDRRNSSSTGELLCFGHREVRPITASTSSRRESVAVATVGISASREAPEIHRSVLGTSTREGCLQSWSHRPDGALGSEVSCRRARPLMRSGAALLRAISQRGAGDLDRNIRSGIVRSRPSSA